MTGNGTGPALSALNELVQWRKLRMKRANSLPPTVQAVLAPTATVPNVKLSDLEIALAEAKRAENLEHRINRAIEIVNRKSFSGGQAGRQEALLKILEGKL